MTMREQAPDCAQYFLDHFSDANAVANYAEGPRRFVPGFDALHTMTSVLLAERAPVDARVLVLGAGGGLELKALASDHPRWTFTGIDPAKPMLDLAAKALSPMMDRVELIEGYIGDAPEGPFDAAVCLLTLHFLNAEDRRRTAEAIHRRLKPGAPFVAAHSSFPQDAKNEWLARYAAYAITRGADPEQAASARSAVAASLNLFDPAQDEEILRNAGFSDAALFFAAFTWRGWIAHA
ncbi:MAG TPA: class I SAM-dependent methyltransferase [Xanthobacteraceae bacterium]|nr:class I SAM-dependent methyltransferase [Xanthobacteraceae bacterium]